MHLKYEEPSTNVKGVTFKEKSILKRLFIVKRNRVPLYKKKKKKIKK